MTFFKELRLLVHVSVYALTLRERENFSCQLDFLGVGQKPLGSGSVFSQLDDRDLILRIEAAHYGLPLLTVINTVT